MTTSAGLHLIAASFSTTKLQNHSIIFTHSRSKHSHFTPNPKHSHLTPKSTRQGIILSIVSTSSSYRQLFPSFFATGFYEAQTEEGPFISPRADEESEAGHEQSSIESRRLYVGNLPFTITSSELSDIFSQAGKIEQVEIIYGRATQRSRGFAFVTLVTSEEANEAIRLFDGAHIGGRTLKVNFPEVPKGGEREVMISSLRANSRGYVDSPHKIYAGNLRWTVTSEVLRDAFSSYSGLLGAKVIYERDSGRSRGFGFVTFVSASECKAALEDANGKMVAGRPLRLNLASNKTSPT